MWIREEEDKRFAATLAQVARPLSARPGDEDELIDLVGDARFVLLGEASHGTHEFYAARARITRRLIEDKGFHAVAVEADWPDAYRVNRWVRGRGAPAEAADEAIDALAGFARFPTWMWRNADVLDFVGWLREHNDPLPPDRRAGFYGLDLYSMYASIDAVLDYVARADPDLAREARRRYACFESFGESGEAYAFLTATDQLESCEQQAIEQLIELRRRPTPVRGTLGPDDDEDEHFHAVQNAQVVIDAERYYRAMYRGRASSWNLRDRHMADTLDALAVHLDRRAGRSRLIVWAHNSHIGDASATEMGAAGELNIGQLMRERHGRDAVLVGFTTYDGTVTAASDWGGPAERMRVTPGYVGSYETLFHETAIPRFFLAVRDPGEVLAGLKVPRLERAIGVVYHPETERVSHYLMSELPRQFDAVYHFDRTRAVEPLERTTLWEAGKPQEPPETFPTGV